MLKLDKKNIAPNKKTAFYKKTVSLAALLLCAVIALSSLVSCVRQPAAPTPTQTPEPVYKTRFIEKTEPLGIAFEADCLESELVDIYVKKGMLTSDRLKELCEEIIAYTDKLVEKYGATKKMTVYALDKNRVYEPYSPAPHAVAVNLQSLDDIGQYVAQAYLGTSDKWIYTGFYEYNEQNRLSFSEIHDYMSKKGVGGLKLYAHDFSDLTINSPDFARGISGSLVEFILNSYSFEQFLGLASGEQDGEMPISLAKVKNDFLNELNLPFTYDDEEKDELFSGSESYISDMKLLIGIKDDSEYWIPVFLLTTSAEYYEDFIEVNIVQRKKTTEFLAAEGGETAKLLKLDVNPTYVFYEGEKTGGTLSYTTPDAHCYLDSSPDAHIHEACHVYLNSHDSDNEHAWLHEGLCEYMDILFGQYSKVETYNMLSDMQGMSDLYIMNDVLDIYLKNGGNMNSAEEFDYTLFMHSISCFIMKEPYLDFGGPRMSEVYSGYIPPDEDLSYEECASFVSFLVSIYGFENVLKVSQDYSLLKQVFGKPYSEIYEDWQNFLNIRFA